MTAGIDKQVRDLRASIRHFAEAKNRPAYEQNALAEMDKGVVELGRTATEMLDALDACAKWLREGLEHHTYYSGDDVLLERVQDAIRKATGEEATR